jgi:hypothetical protein
MIDRYREEARAERERNGEAPSDEVNNMNREEGNVDAPPDLEEVSDEERKSQSLNTSTTVVNGETILTYNTATD